MNKSLLIPIVATVGFVLPGHVLAADFVDDNVARQRASERAREINIRAVPTVHQNFVGVELELMAPRGRIGVTLSQVHEALATHLGLDASEVILIDSVIPGAAADTAGVKAYDIITHVDGKSPVTQQSLRETVVVREPGETVRLTVLRGGETHELDVKVELPEPPPSGESVFGGRARLQLEGRDAEQLMRQLNEMLESRGVDEDVRGMLREHISEWSERRPTSMYRFEEPREWREFRDQLRERGREVEIMRDGDEAVQMWMRPARPSALQAAPQYFFRENFEAQHVRMQRIEERLERIERMLEQILESTRN